MSPNSPTDGTPPKDKATPATFGPPPVHPFVADPGEQFETEAHRRVLAHLPTPTEDSTIEQVLIGRLGADVGSPRPLTVDEIRQILNSLAQAGYVSTDNGLAMTEAGLEALNL